MLPCPLRTLYGNGLDSSLINGRIPRVLGAHLSLDITYLMSHDPAHEIHDSPTGACPSQGRQERIRTGLPQGSLKTTHPLFKADEPLLDEKRAVAAWLKEIPKGGLLFPITRQHFHRLFQGYCKEAGIPKPLAHPHTLKHSVAMELVRKVGIEELRQYIGHKSLNSTGQYLKVSDQQACQAVAAAMDF